MNKNFCELDQRILRILVPAILENALLILSGMILTGYIGRLAVSEISAYGVGNRIFNIYFAVFKGFSIGALVVIARYYGSGLVNKCEGLYKQSCALFIPLSIIVTALIVGFPKQLLSLMTSEAELLEIGGQFIRAQVICYPLVALVHLNSAAFQSTGDTKTPLFIAVIGNVVNIIFGYALIFGAGSFTGFGLMGAAYARTLSYAIMTLTGIFLLYNRSGLYAGLLLEKVHFNMDEVKDLMKAGLPAAVENSCWNFATVYITRAILTYGQTFYAAYQLGLEAEGFCDMMSAGFMTASMALSAHAIGARDKQKYVDSFKRLHVFVLIVSAITMTFLALFSRTVLSFLTDKEELILIGIPYLTAMIGQQYANHMQKVALGYIRSAGHNNVSMIISMLGVWGVRVVLTYFISSVWKLNIIWCWWAFDIDQWAKCLMALGYIKFTHLMDNAIMETDAA